MATYQIIANPSAGHGKGGRAIPEIEQELRRLNLDFNLVRTERPLHGMELARQAVLAGVDVVVAAGGDGTVNEVLNGLIEARKTSPNRPALGVLCTGRGNDFAACLRIPGDLASGCQVLQGGRRRLIDIGHVVGGRYPQGRYFANTVGVGFDAIGTIQVAKLPDWGMLSFLIAILKTILLYYRGPKVRIDYDGQSLTSSTLMFLTMNGQRMGTGFKMAPESQPDDGWFDLVLVRQVSRARILSLIPHFLKGTQATQPEISTQRAAKVSITALEGVLPAQTDGEILCVDGTRLDIQLLPRQVEVVCPKEVGT